jgi:DNA-binding response OmpR family regulator
MRRCGTGLAPVSDVPGSETPRGSILVVDDEPAVAEMLRDILVSEGYAVDRAANGGDALMLVSLSRPDAVILDIKLPDTSGPEILARLRELDESVPVLMLSGSDDEELARALKAGAMDGIRKPFDFDALLRAVALAVEVGKGRARRGVVVPFDPDRRRRVAAPPEPEPLTSAPPMRAATRPRA